MVGGIRRPQSEHDFWNGEAGPEQDILGVGILHEWEPVQDLLDLVHSSLQSRPLVLHTPYGGPQEHDPWLFNEGNTPVQRILSQLCL